MDLASFFSPEVHEEKMSNPVSSADIISSIRESELEEEILQLKKDLDLAKRDPGGKGVLDKILDRSAGSPEAPHGNICRQPQ